MIEQLSKYTKWWNEFVEWMDGKGFYLMPKEIHISNKHKFMHKEFAYMISDRELLSLLVEFCDSKNYFIEYSHTGTNWLTYIYKQETETTFNLDPFGLTFKLAGASRR